MRFLTTKIRQISPLAGCQFFSTCAILLRTMPAAKPKPAASSEAPAAVFDRLLPLLKDFSKHFTVRQDSGPKRGYHLWSVKPIKHEGRTYPELSFASLIQQKDFTGFYFFPIYCHPELKEELSPTLLGTLKGKTCFHIKRADPSMLAAIRAALELGLKDYKSRQWLQ
ncbi:MAG: hypothetical protein ABSD13_00130 [Candidatus Korobacteraceae bacterium]